MGVTYDHIVEVDRLKRPIEVPHLTRGNGYAVDLDGQWFWFHALEPAYAFGRSGRMSLQVSSWGVGPAATEARFDARLKRDVFTLYVCSSGWVDQDEKSDRELLSRFVDGIDPRSSHWNA